MASMGHCSQCGKDFPMLYPHMWRYKTGNKLFCSWHCLRADERKEEDEMARLKKDGTPWGKPGPKTDVKVEKVPKVEPVQCIAHVTDAELEEAEQAVSDLILQGGVNYQLKVDEAMKKPEVAMRGITVDTELGTFSLVEGTTGEIMWDTVPNDYVKMTREQWSKLAEIIPRLLKTLGVEV